MRIVVFAVMVFCGFSLSGQDSLQPQPSESSTLNEESIEVELREENGDSTLGEKALELLHPIEFDGWPTHNGRVLYTVFDIPGAVESYEPAYESAIAGNTLMIVGLVGGLGGVGLTLASGQASMESIVVTGGIGLGVMILGSIMTNVSMYTYNDYVTEHNARISQ
jgi:hypothetical protein